ncbi:MAG: deoxyribonuclease IV [Candidatus Aenigmatarchaeota archaeon]|nr:TIM barrel protein [Nanoarchaeota archaeon]
MNKLNFGTAGIPVSTQGDTLQGIQDVKKLGLDAMELEFVRSINISKEKAPEVKKTAKESNVILTCHAPYFINLNSLDKKKLEASKNRILASARRAYESGAYSMCFHPGFYMKMDAQRVYENIKKELQEIMKMLNQEGVDIWVRPETTGKGTQFGSLDELARITSEVDGMMPCVDFSHLHARSGGKFNTSEEFRQVLETIEKFHGKEGLKNMHIHVSGIAYSEKGERNHLNLKQSDMNYKDLMKVWKEFKIAGVVISESPNIEEDALLMKKTYKLLK